MIERALDAEVRFAWLIADEACGQMNSLRVWLKETICVVHAGHGRGDDVFTRTGAAAGRADEMIATGPPKQCRRISGDGTRG
ncbi:hypothetical protein [Rhodococcus sp. JS3073]|uniref:hypothetical protein n=1 Tax=Rhodococcus sp. JS3073 TaxID=3002901 RepID=UPI003FA777CD